MIREGYASGLVYVPCHIKHGMQISKLKQVYDCRGKLQPKSISYRHRERDNLVCSCWRMITQFQVSCHGPFGQPPLFGLHSFAIARSSSYPPHITTPTLARRTIINGLVPLCEPTNV